VGSSDPTNFVPHGKCSSGRDFLNKCKMRPKVRHESDDRLAFLCHTIVAKDVLFWLFLSSMLHKCCDVTLMPR
jgi:hypothetical protein